METYQYKFLKGVEEMLPYYGLVMQMGYEFTEEQYQIYLEEMIPKGYAQLVILEGSKAIGLSGYWINTKLFSGKYVEMDNVIVDSSYRSMGIGRRLCEKIEEEAKAQGCNISVLDAYVENFRAHSFYFRQGYVIRGYHFLKKLHS